MFYNRDTQNIKMSTMEAMSIMALTAELDKICNCQSGCRSNCMFYAPNHVGNSCMYALLVNTLAKHSNFNEIQDNM